MAANDFNERILVVGEPAWHHKGLVVDPAEKITAVNAVERARMNYKYIKGPLESSIEILPGVFTKQVVPGQCVIWREPTEDDPNYIYMGTASCDYGLIQNTDVAAQLDRLTGDMPVETVGALGSHGETVFFTLDAGITEVKGEQIHQYFLVTDTKKPGTSMKIAFTPVRVVCQNTLISGLSQATITANMVHHSGIANEFSFRVGLVEKMTKARQTTIASFELLAAAAITPNDLDQMLEQAYPMPTKPAKSGVLDAATDPDDIATLGELYNDAARATETWAYYCGRVKTFQDSAKLRFERINDEYPNIANTAWAGYNSIVENEDYRDGSDSRFESAMIGPRANAKKRAFRTALMIAQAKA